MNEFFGIVGCLACCFFFIFVTISCVAVWVNDSDRGREIEELFQRIRDLNDRHNRRS